MIIWSRNLKPTRISMEWNLVPLIGGRWYIIPQLAVYTTSIPLIYCQLGGYMLPTTYSGNQKQLLNMRKRKNECSCLKYGFGRPSDKSLRHSNRMWVRSCFTCAFGFEAFGLLGYTLPEIWPSETGNLWKFHFPTSNHLFFLVARCSF